LLNKLVTISFDEIDRQSFAVDSTVITDVGREHLRKRPFEEVDRTGTKVTASGVPAMRKAQPGCHVLWPPPG
jgi:hypothetical protein